MWTLTNSEFTSLLSFASKNYTHFVVENENGEEVETFEFNFTESGKLVSFISTRDQKRYYINEHGYTFNSFIDEEGALYIAIGGSLAKPVSFVATKKVSSSQVVADHQHDTTKADETSVYANGATSCEDKGWEDFMLPFQKDCLNALLDGKAKFTNFYSRGI